MTFIAYYLHWPPERVLELEHAERRRWADEVSRLNQRINDGSAEVRT